MSMYWFGSFTEVTRPWESEDAWKELSRKKLLFAQTSLNDIISTLDSFGRSWSIGGALFEQALPQLIKESGLSQADVKQTLGLLPALLSKESLERRLLVEFQSLDILDRFMKPSQFSGRVRAVPLGTVLHVTAGNVFLSSIDSLLMGLMTKNISIIKVSSQNTFFPLFFAQQLALYDKQQVLSDKFAVLHWKGGDQEVEDHFKQKVDAIVAWGGEEMIESYRHDLPVKVKFLPFGPKVSLQVISKEGLKGKDLFLVAKKVVADIVPWDQSACASPQNLYLQEGSAEDELLAALESAFQEAPPRGALGKDESVEILKESYRSMYSELMEGGKGVSGENFLLHLESNKVLRPSPLNRSLIIKRFKDAEELSEILSPFSYYLQSCSYLFSEIEKDHFLGALALAGIKRFAPLGTITWGMVGAPHDGKMVLRELVQFIGDELRMQDFGEEQVHLKTSLDLKNEFELGKHPKGYIYSSGGTTGAPKFVHFSYEEFDYIADMLAFNLKCQGVTAGMTVANLFVAGNLWSSFLAMDKALEKIGAIQLPIGGLCPVDNIIFYLNKFRPNVVIGIPSLLISYAETAQRQGNELKVPMVFYAGEALSITRQEYLRNVWKTNYIGSAGYASVDAGMIGYQCSFSSPGDHHLFSDLVELKIINEEAVVSSLYRTSMPISHYRTGDKVEWIEACGCGRKDPRFRLLGRVDNVIFAWSCRMRLQDIESSLVGVDTSIKTYQVKVLSDSHGNDMVELYFEGKGELSSTLVEKIYESSRDVKDTIGFNEFKQVFRALAMDAGKIERNPRTGKISLVLDLRQ